MERPVRLRSALRATSSLQTERTCILQSKVSASRIKERKILTSRKVETMGAYGFTADRQR